MSSMRGTVRILAAGLVAIALVVTGAAAAQEPPPDDGSDDRLDELIDEQLAAILAAEAEFISPELADVEVDSLPYRHAFSRFIYAVEALADVTEARLDAERNLVTLQADEVRLTGEIAEAVQRKKGLTLELVGIRSRIRGIAVAGYVAGDNTLRTARSFDIAGVTESQTRHILVGTVSDDTKAALDDTTMRLGQAATDVDDRREERRTVRARIARVTTDREAALAEEARLTEEVAQREVELVRARVLAYVVGGDFALVTMDAYWRASRADADCALSWWGLAGIGRVESRHAQSQHAVVDREGDTFPHIIGIPLDGTNGTALIPDTDGGELDGDLEYDRAVGPMQFIPSTWVAFATDGDGDGDADPHNVYDAARSAAAYICRYGPLDNDDGLRRAYFAYNHSDSYVESVLRWAHQYETIAIPLP